MFTLTQEFNGLSPFDVYRERYVDVIKMYADLREMKKTEERLTNPNRVVRRRAGDDWF
jgi:hypothetical protein